MNSLPENSKVLVTGGSGFIGSHLIELLCKSDVQIDIIDFVEPSPKMAAPHRYMKVDLVSYLSSSSCDLSRYDYIFHLAGNAHPFPSVENPVKDFNMNLNTTLLFLESLKRIKERPKLINVSSAAVYGDPLTFPIKESDPTVPLSPYGVSKLAAENYVSVYSRLYGVSALSVRPFSIYGPRLRKQVVFDLLTKLHADPHTLEVYGDGKQMRDFLYVKDLVGAMLVVAAQGKGNGETYNIASGTSYSIQEVIDTMCGVLGIKPDLRYSGKVRPGEPEKWIVDIAKIQHTGFKPEVSLQDGLAETIGWFKSGK
jgi:UDP-glucose 4-epimerase